MHAGYVYIVEDDDSVRQSLQDLLRYAEFNVRAWARAEAFLEEMPTAAPAVLLTDMRMPGMSGIELHEELIARGRNIPTVYISGESTLPQGIQAMKLGAHDFLVKPFAREQVLKAVASGLERDRFQMQIVIQQARFDAGVSRLSQREREVMRLLLKGYSNQEVMSELRISLATAKQYKSQLMKKLGIRSLSELMKFGAAGQ